MSEFNFREEWGIPTKSDNYNLKIAKEFQIPKAMVEAAKNKIQNPFKLGQIYTTLARAIKVEEVNNVFEQGIVRPTKTGIMAGENQLVFINRLTEKNKTYLDDPIISSRAYSQGGFSITFILNEEQLKADNFIISEAPYDKSGKPMLSAGGTIEGSQDIKPSYFSGVIIGIGSKDSASASKMVTEEAYRRINVLESKEGRSSTADERVAILHDVQTEFATKCQSDIDGTKSVALKVLLSMVHYYRENPNLALPIYDLQGNLLWPKD